MKHVLTGCLMMLLTSACFAASLWTGTSATPYADAKARAVGDLLTVIIVQESSATTAATHTTAKGVDVKGNSGTGWFGGFAGLGVKADRATTGAGTAAASTKLVDRLTVRVTEVLPNGNLKVEGNRVITLEKDEMNLIFRGTVRQADVSPENTIASTLVADQQLEAKGNGPIAEKQRPGLLSRLLSFLW